jgi:hypothetical protein
MTFGGGKGLYADGVERTSLDVGKTGLAIVRDLSLDAQQILFQCLDNAETRTVNP